MILKKKNKVKISLGLQLVRLVMFLGAITVVFPLIWVLYTSFKSNKEFYADVWALPEVLRFENYQFAWETANFSKYYLNSLFTVGLTLILTLLMTTTSAYILAKYRYRWLGIVQKFYILARAVPGVLILIPQYFMFLRMGMTDSLWSLSLLYALGSVPFSVYMQIGFIQSVPDALLEAATIDGASEWQKFSKVVIPCIKPALFVTILNNVLHTWNEYVLALTFLSDESKQTVPVGLAQLQHASAYSVEYGGLFAGLIIAMIPIIIIYMIFQKRLHEGVKTAGSVKG